MFGKEKKWKAKNGEKRKWFGRRENKREKEKWREKKRVWPTSFLSLQIGEQIEETKICYVEFNYLPLVL